MHVPIVLLTLSMFLWSVSAVPWNHTVRFSGRADVDAREWLGGLKTQCERNGISLEECADTGYQLLDPLPKIVLALRGGMSREDADLDADQSPPSPWTAFEDDLILIHDVMKEIEKKMANFLVKAEEVVEKFKKEHPELYEAILVGTITAATYILIPPSIRIILSLVGFRLNGVALGTLAARLQSLLYGGKTGGLFSHFQRWGATWLGRTHVFRGTLAGLLAGGLDRVKQIFGDHDAHTQKLTRDLQQGWADLIEQEGVKIQVPNAALGMDTPVKTAIVVTLLAVTLLMV